jgi:uncharacterized protein (TIGR02246 family)
VNAVADDIEARLSALARRVQALEDERAVVDVLTRYGFAVDSDDPDGTGALYTEDCTIEIDGRTDIRSREDVAGMVRGRGHQSILPNCSHQMGPFSVRLDGDRATATGYGTVYLHTDGGFGVRRVSAGRWELRRIDGQWQIERRWTRAIGSTEAQQLLHEGL